MKPVANFRKQILRVLMLPTLLCCMVSAAFFGLVVQLLSELDRVGQTDRLIARANAASRSLVDRDIALRRYLVSGAPALLPAYREANARLGGRFDELSRLTSDDPDQSIRLARLLRQSKVWGHNSGEAIDFRASPSGRNRNPEADGGQERMDEIRDSMTAFLDAEEEHRDHRSDAIQSRSWSLLAACSGAAISLGSILVYSSRRYLVVLCGAFEAALQELEAKSNLQELENLNLLSEVMKYYAIFSLDSEGRIASWNEDAERILGYRADEVLDRRPSCFYSREDVKRDVFFHDLEWAALEGRLEDERWLIRKDGFRFKARVAMVATRDSTGRLSGYTNVVHEIEHQGPIPEADDE